MQASGPMRKGRSRLSPLEIQRELTTYTYCLVSFHMLFVLNKDPFPSQASKAGVGSLNKDKSNHSVYSLVNPEQN